MKIKYMIHRSEKPFLEAKELFRRIVQFYKKDHPSLIFIDRGKKFSITYKEVIIDFDHGYFHMERRSFKSYAYVLSTGMFAVLSPNLTSGTIALPASYDCMTIAQHRKELRIERAHVSFHNPMERVMTAIARYEPKIREKLRKELRDKKLSLKNLPLQRKARFLNCNTLFLPSQLTNTKSFIGKKELPQLQTFLETHYDGLHCDGLGMLQSAKGKVFLLSFGLDKPYHLVELTDALRTAQGIKKALPSFNLNGYEYFNYLFFGYLLSKEFKI
jgi:hypothetical protein